MDLSCATWPRYPRPAVVDARSSREDTGVRRAHDTGDRVPERGHPRDDESDGAIRFLCFRLAGQEFAADIRQVKETMMMVPITRVFLTPRWLAGIINLRGDIVAVLDLAQFLGLPATVVSDHSRIIICRHGGKTAGIVVDEMANLRVIASDRMKPAPATLNSESAALLTGVVVVENDAAVRVLDIARLFAAEPLRAFQRPDAGTGRPGAE